LASRWCFKTHTFVVSWGYFTVTLEDEFELFHFLLVGKVGPSSLELWPHEEEKVSTLYRLVTISRKRRSRIILEVKGFKIELELTAFLAMWLSRYIFKGNPQDGVCYWLFPIALKLASESSFSLALIFLGTLYERLDQYQE
ncbi:PMD domain-containing protein, partial [Cephalotus follicularis]